MGSGLQEDIGEAGLSAPMTIMVRVELQVGVLIHANTTSGVGHAENTGIAVAVEYFDFSFVEPACERIPRSPVLGGISAWLRQAFGNTLPCWFK